MSSKRHRGGHHEEEHENHERWLVSYADMMTLLFALFLVLYAMSVVDLNKFKAFRQAFQAGLYDGVQALPEQGNPTEGDPDTEVPGNPPEPTETVVNAAPMPEDAVTETAELQALKAQLEQAIAGVGLSDSVSVALDSRGLAVYVSDGVLFDSGQARLLGDGEGLIRQLQPILAGVGNKLIVEGHTDDVPIASAQYPSNWELSTSRATVVLRELLAAPGMDASRVSAAGYADTRPRQPNDSPEHRSANRRVEVIVVVPPKAPAPAPPAPPEAAPPEPADDGH